MTESNWWNKDRRKRAQISQDRGEERHIVFLQTFGGEVLQPPANKTLFEVFLNCCQGLNVSQKQKYVCTVRVFKLTESLWVNKSIFCVCICAYSVYLCERKRGRWREGKENKKVSSGWMWRKDQIQILLLAIWTSTKLTGRKTFFHPRKSWTSHSQTHTLKSASNLKPISTSSSRLGIRFQAKSKQVTSLEVITQVAYLAGQTNMAASWHPEDRSKCGPDKEHSNTGLLATHMLWFSLNGCMRVFIAACVRTRARHILSHTSFIYSGGIEQLKDGEES